MGVAVVDSSFVAARTGVVVIAMAGQGHYSYIADLLSGPLIDLIGLIDLYQRC